MRTATAELMRTLSTMLTVFVPFSSAWAQCSVCQAALANSENGGAVIGGFQQGIGLMFAVMGVLGVIGWRIARRARAEFGNRQSQQSNTVSAPDSGMPAEGSVNRQFNLGGASYVRRIS